METINEKDGNSLQPSCKESLCTVLILKLYCGYKYIRSCMINGIWGRKQQNLYENIYAWINFQGIHRAVKKGNKRKIQNVNICLRRESNQLPLAF